MNETVIKEIKSIYSGRIKSTVPPTVVAPEISTIKPHTHGEKKSFFNGVIDKLNIIVSEKK
jgi:hypothetical protein